MQQQLAIFDEPSEPRPDYVVGSTSGGKDSFVSLAIASRWAAERGIPFIAVHADMGRMEWSGSLELVRAQSDYFGIKDTRIVHRKQGDLLSQCIEKRSWSRVGGMNGPCQGTSDHKRGPILTAYTAIAKEWREKNGLGSGRGHRPVRILEVVGIAGHEGNKRRAHMSSLEQAPQSMGGRLEVQGNPKSNGLRQVTTWYPIADYASEQDVWDFIAKEALLGAPEQAWPYKAGMPRYSCSFCVFASRDALNLAAQLNPELFQEYLAAEQIIGPWRQEFSLQDIADDIAAGRLVKSATQWGDQG